MSGAAEETLDDELGQQALGQGDGLPGNGERGDGGGAVDEDLRLSCQLLRSADSSRLARGGASETYALVVDDLDDGGQAAGEGVVAVDENDAADLNEAPVGSLNHCFAHRDGCLSRILCQSRVVSGVVRSRREDVLIPIVEDVCRSEVVGFLRCCHRGVANDFLSLGY